MSVLLSRLAMSLLADSSSSTLSWSWLLTVVSSSLSDCSSSLEVSSSSLADWSSSFIDMTSSFDALSSSLALSNSSMVPCRSSRSRSRAPARAGAAAPALLSRRASCLGQCRRRDSAAPGMTIKSKPAVCLDGLRGSPRCSPGGVAPWRIITPSHALSGAFADGSADDDAQLDRGALGPVKAGSGWVGRLAGRGSSRSARAKCRTS